MQLQHFKFCNITSWMLGAFVLFAIPSAHHWRLQNHVTASESESPCQLYPGQLSVISRSYPCQLYPESESPCQLI